MAVHTCTTQGTALFRNWALWHPDCLLKGPNTASGCWWLTGKEGYDNRSRIVLETPIVSSILPQPESSVHYKVCVAELMSHGIECQHKIHATISDRPLIHHAWAAQSCPLLSSFREGYTVTQLCPFLAHSQPTSTSRLERPLYDHRVSHSSTFEQGDDRVAVRPAERTVFLLICSHNPRF